MSQAFQPLRKIDDFLAWWKNESDGTRKILGALTDASLKQSVAQDHRTLGRMAWHLAGSVAEMAGRTGIQLDGPKETDPVPATAAEILKVYDSVATSLSQQVKANWTDETLKQEDDMYGMIWPRGLTLVILVTHEIHHRAQMTVLMRQAGLVVPGVYGPALEEWKSYGANPPVV